MSVRPIYVGVGECGCGRLDVALYQLPGTPVTGRLACAWCLADQGLIVTRPRTADDLELVNGVPQWKVPAPAPRASTAGALELGAGHFFVAVFDADDAFVGWLHRHPRADGEGVCQTFCAVRYVEGVPIYRIDSADPLTLSPDVCCRLCGSHGRVVNGMWLPT